MSVIDPRPCMICDRHTVDGFEVMLKSKCVCPYPHWTLPLVLPWWRPAIDHSRAFGERRAA